MALLASLNSRQREAVLHSEGPLLVLAGAGSGKTRVVVTRIAYLILERRVAPEAILAVTFTNKAAGEMRERVTRLLEEHGLESSAKPTVSTFHSFCVRLLRRFGSSLADLRKGFTPRFLIFDESDQLSVIKSASKELDIDSKFIKPSAARTAISKAKNLGRTSIGSPLHQNAQTLALNQIFDLYQDKLLESNALDFDDLLLEAVNLLRSSERVREIVRAQYRYLMVDEYQDTNRPQYELMRLLAEPRCNVCVVGDEDQAIYSWRGADINNILGFEEDFQDAKIIRLEQNYRSTGSILRAASAVVECNVHRKGKRLWTAGPNGDLPALYCAWDGYGEARYVAQAMGEILDRDPTTRVGILYRTNSQSRLIEEALRREGREFTVVGGVAFYQRAEIKDLLSYLRVAVAPDDAVSLRRVINVPARGIGKSTLDRLQTYASQANVSLWRAIEHAVNRHVVPLRARIALRKFRKLITDLRARLEIDDLESLLGWLYVESNYRDMLETNDSAESESRIENIKELVVAAQEADRKGQSLHDFLDQSALVSDSDQIDQTARIQLMTLHTAKGLEFPAAAIVGMEEELLPHARSLDGNEEALEEERRLCYVGMTRARRYLLLTCAQQRRRFGAESPVEMAPSRFLEEIPRELLEDRSGARWGGMRGYGRAYAKSRGQTASSEPVAAYGTPSGEANADIATHDSVAAVADFFNQRGIETPEPIHPKPASAPKAAPAATPRPWTQSRRRRAEPKLGQALKTLRGQGPFARGTRVKHKKFGVGVVRRREGEGPRAKLIVYFENYGLRKLVAGYANLLEV